MQNVGEAAGRLGRFGKATQDEKKKKDPDMVGRIQKFAKEENERKKKAAADKAKGVQTTPEKGFLQRMYEKYVSSGEKK